MCLSTNTHTHANYLSFSPSISSSFHLQLITLLWSRFNSRLYSFMYSFIGGNFQLIWDSIKSQRAVMQTENNFHFLDALMPLFFSCLELFYSVSPTLDFPLSYCVPEEDLHIITYYLTNGIGVSSQVSTGSFILKCQHVSQRVCYSHFFFESTMTSAPCFGSFSFFKYYLKCIHIYLHIFHVVSTWSVEE